MLGFEDRNHAFAENERAYLSHCAAVERQQEAVNSLNSTIEASCALLADCEGLLLRFTKTPQTFCTGIAQISAVLAESCGVEYLRRGAENEAFEIGATGLIGGTTTIIGTQVASKLMLGKSIGVATAKTTAAIATSSKLAAAGTAGGAVVRAKFATLLGPVGVAVGVGFFLWSWYSTYESNISFARRAFVDTSRLKQLTATTKQRTHNAERFMREIDLVWNKVEGIAGACSAFDNDYSALNGAEKNRLWELLNCANVLSGLIQRTVTEV